jgi:cell division control protein 6
MDLPGYSYYFEVTLNIHPGSIGITILRASVLVVLHSISWMKVLVTHVEYIPLRDPLSGASLESARRIMEEAFIKPSVFRRKEALYPEYVPPSLPHRENQLRRLAEIFKPLIVNPGEASIKAVVVGGVGTGKTVTTRVFGTELRSIARRRGIDVRYVHINCHRDRTLYEVVSEIARQADVPISQRGFSPHEIFGYVHQYIDRQRSFLLIALDEFDYFVDAAGSDAVYFLMRVYDEHPELTKRINYILIMRSLSGLSKVDSATYSYVTRYIVSFEPYRSRELRDILRQRRDEAFHPGTVGDDVIGYIADLEGSDKGGSGNARAAIETLLLAGEAADSEGSQVVSVEHVRRARGYVAPDVVTISDSLQYLSLHELLVLKALIRNLRRSQAPYVTMGSVENEYRDICRLYDEKPRRHTQLYEYVVNMRRMGIVEAKPSGKGMRGRTTMIGIGGAPLDPLEKRVDELIKVRLGGRGQRA